VALHFVIGPVGAGKSTYARRRCAATAAVFLDVDTWMVRLYGGDRRPADNVMAWYIERRERARELIWDTAVDALRAGATVYLELGLVTIAEREAWFDRARAGEEPMTITLLDAPVDVRRDRVLARNMSGAPHTQVVPPALFEAASNAWQPVSDDERRRWNIVDV